VGRLLSFAFALAVLITCSNICVSGVQYVIQPGDTVAITVLGEPDLTKRLVVDPMGSVALPLIGEVHIAGLTATEAADEITRCLKKVMKYPQVTVELVEVAKVQVTVSGEVRNPGIYHLPGGAKLMDAVTAAGGYLPSADLSNVKVSHAGSEENVVIDLTKFLLSGESGLNIPLKTGDTVVIPPGAATSGSVMVIGAVRQPGVHPLTQGMTLRDAILAAGGPTEFADLSNVSLKRSQSSDVVTVDYSEVMSGNVLANPQLQPGDVISIPTKVQLGSYTIYGAVAHPGKYDLKGKTTLTEAIAIAGGVLERARLDEVRIVRLTSGGQTQTFQVDVGDIMNGKAENFQIQDGDNVYVPLGKEKVDYLRIVSVLVSIGWLLTQR
jgi:protein involved in polysaccharide export with SLBB domain